MIIINERFLRMKSLLRTAFLIGILLAAFNASYAKATPKYYLANWDSLKNYQVPEWYQDAKFGIWTHWGVYSVPAYRGTHAAEWYPKWMYLKEDASKPFGNYEKQGVAIMKHHLEKYGSPAAFGYHDFIPMFKAEKWDPDNWAQLGIDSGAKFFTITGMHHDGFAMYDSDYTKFDAMDMGPKRDLTGDLAKAVRAKGLKFGISNHFAHNIHHYTYLFENYKEIVEKNPELAGLYSNGIKDRAYVERWWNITTEMVRKYNPDLYYFDWGWNTSFWDQERPEFTAYFYNHAIRTGRGTFGNPNVVLNTKNNSVPKECNVLDIERGGMGTVQDFVWQTDTSISDYSWGYSEDDTFKSPKALICMLTDIVSKNGVLMLNFGPRADGTIPEECRYALVEMGKWLKANGEAIYSTRPWEIAGEGPTSEGGHGKNPEYIAKDIRYTKSKDGQKLYATAFGLPKEATLTLNLVKVLSASDNAKVTMLSNGKNIPFEVNRFGQLVLNLSGITAQNAGCDYAYSFSIEGMTLSANKLEPIDLSTFYMKDAMNHNTLPGTYNSQYPYLSAIEPVYVKAHNGVKRDSNYHGHTPIMIGDKTYSNGLMMCPSGDGNKGIFIVKMDKLPKVKGFTADIGIEEMVKTSGSSAFIIEAYVGENWQQVYKSKTLKGSDKPVHVDVKFPAGAEYIRFITTDGGNGCSADHALWADAKFTE